MPVKIFFILLFIPLLGTAQSRGKARSFGIQIGVMNPGKWNAITDVQGVKVGHFTWVRGKDIRTGVTAIVPHGENVFLNKVPAAIWVGNGFGKLAGYTQVRELGNLESPIILTNTLGVGTALEALVEYTLKQPGNENVRSVNGVVGETNDGYLNNIRALPIGKDHVWKALEGAKEGPVEEGAVGAGTGTVCFGFKGGIGTSSRVLPPSLGGYVVGVLVQSNFGGALTIDGVPIGEELGQYFLHDKLGDKADGSCMIVVATDAPLDSRNLERLAKRAMLGLGRAGGIGSNGSGDYVIAFSTAPQVRIKQEQDDPLVSMAVLRNDAMSPLFMAVIEATEEAIINSLFQAQTMMGMEGREVPGLPLGRVLELMEKHQALQKK